MKTEVGRIESEWECTKLLVCGETDRRYLAYMLGGYGIYLESFCKLDITNNNGVFAPGIATVRYPEYGMVLDFVAFEPQCKASIIFKHGRYFSSIEDSAGLAANTAMNALGLRKGSTFYIDSNDKEVRDFFYMVAKRANDLAHFECKFDYDCYHYKLYIKRYNKKNGQIVLVVIMTGKDMPNVWKFDQNEFCQEDCCEEEPCCDDVCVYGNYTVLSDGVWTLTCLVEICECCDLPLDECECDIEDIYDESLLDDDEDIEDDATSKDCC